jgi:hypothetical protein
MRTPRLIALAVLVIIPAAIVGARRIGTPQNPSRLAVGETVPASIVRYATAAGLSATADTVDVVFVARDCSACQQMVEALHDRRSVPKPGRELLFLVDVSWPVLDSLAGGRIHVQQLTDSTATAVGVRATPTIISYARASTVAGTVRIGSSAVESTVVPRP